MKKIFSKTIILSALLLCLVLCACGETAPETAAPVSDPPPPVSAPSPTPPPPETFYLCGNEYRYDAKSIDLTGLSDAEAKQAAEELSSMPELEEIILGSETESPLSWESIGAIHSASPEAVIQYAFTIYKRSFDLSDETMDLKYIKMTDEGELIKQIAPCMTRLRFLDMDSCEVSNESMAELRDSLPDTEVVWRINFGAYYTARTNTEKILASLPGKGGELVHNNVHDLMYCTKVKYIDLGHNNYLDTIEFCRYMPELEVAIFGMSFVEDFSPLACCPKLEYLEAMTTRLHDLTPFAELKNLKHLNICYNFAITDISPLFGLTQLERLWIGKYAPVPPEQIEQMQRCAPDCVINITTPDPTEEGWRFDGGDEMGNPRYAERYGQLRDQFGYNESDYAFIWCDPLYDYTWKAPEHEPDVVEDFPNELYE